MGDRDTQNAKGPGQQNFQYEPGQTDTHKQTDSDFAPSGFSGGDVKFGFDFKMEESDEAILLRMRSQAYMDIVASIDLLSSTDQEIIDKLQEVVDEEILEEFSEMSLDELLEELRLSFEEEMSQRQVQLQALPKPVELLGVFSECFITGCDIHAIDSHGNILEHYRKIVSMPKEFGEVREVYYAHKGCQCVEVYSNCYCVVFPDGSVKQIYYDEV